MCGWFAETWTKEQFTVSKTEMLDLPWFNIEKRSMNSQIVNVLMLEWVCHFRPTHSLWDGPEDTLFIMMRNKFVREAPAYLNSSVIALLCKPLYLGN